MPSNRLPLDADHVRFIAERDPAAVVVDEREEACGSLGRTVEHRAKGCGLVQPKASE